MGEHCSDADERLVRIIGALRRWRAPGAVLRGESSVVAAARLLAVLFFGCQLLGHLFKEWYPALHNQPPHPLELAGNDHT